MKRKTKHATKSNKNPKTLTESGTPRIRRMVIPAALNAKAEEIFAAQPAIGKYVRGSHTTAKLSAEEFLVCAFYEALQVFCADIPIIREAELQAKETAIRRELKAATEAKSPLPIWASAPNEEIVKLTSVGAVEPVSDRTSALIKVHTVTECLAPTLNALTKQSQPVAVKWGDPAAWNLVVEGRADLTKLRKHILTGGGKGFLRNDILAHQVPQGLCKDLFAKGQFIPGTDAILVRKQKPTNRQNATQRAARKPSERWIGFGLDYGVWRVRLWRVRNNKILETRRPPEMYYGMPLNRPFTAFLDKLNTSFPKAEGRNGALLE